MDQTSYDQIRTDAEHGDPEAGEYLRLVQHCAEILYRVRSSGSYAEKIEDAMKLLVPDIYELSSDGWESLEKYLPKREL